MKYNRRYLTTNSFNEDKSNIQKLNVAVSQDVEASKVYLHKLNQIVSPSESSPCDICFYDKTNDKLVIVKGDMWNVESFPSSKYTPIGVVVVPGKHNVYGDGSCGVMSLKEMNYNTPDEGTTSHQGMLWGQAGTDIPLLTNRNVICHIGDNGNPQDAIQGTASNGYLPSDKLGAVQCPHDTDIYYYRDKSYDYYIPSPYLTNGDRNSLYYQTIPPSSANNAMSDFDGKNNSRVLWTYATAQDNWKTASTITNNGAKGYSPAACCCWRYHTDGTSQGDWYLPACGELGYIMPPFNKINQTITNMCTAYSSSVGVELDTNNIYWSSTECDSQSAFYINTQDGSVYQTFRFVSGYRVRAFLKVK